MQGRFPLTNARAGDYGAGHDTRGNLDDRTPWQIGRPARASQRQTHRGPVTLIENLKTAGQHATAAARESLQEAQLNQELNRAYNELGHTTFELLQQGALTDRRLAPGADCIRELTGRLAALAHAKGRSQDDVASHTTTAT